MRFAIFLGQNLDLPVLGRQNLRFCRDFSNLTQKMGQIWPGSRPGLRGPGEGGSNMGITHSLDTLTAGLAGEVGAQRPRGRWRQDVVHGDSAPPRPMHSGIRSLIRGVIYLIISASGGKKESSFQG